MKDTVKRKKVIIIQDYNTPYRNDLFSTIGSFRDIELHLVYVGTLSQNRKWKDPLKGNFIEHQIRIRKVDVINYETSISTIDYFDFFRVVIKIKPDVIIIYFGQILLNVILPLCLILNFSLVSWTEVTVIAAKGYKAMYHKLFDNIFKSYIVPGVLAKEYLVCSGFRVKSSNTFFAPNSVDDIFNIQIEEVNNRYSIEHPIKFLFVGSYIELKGFIYFILHRFKE